MIPNHLLGTTPTVEALRPKSPTQLREEAEHRHGTVSSGAAAAVRVVAMDAKDATVAVVVVVVVLLAVVVA